MKIIVDPNTGLPIISTDPDVKVVSGGGSGGLGDAPQDGSNYGRKDGAWAVVTGGTGSSPLTTKGDIYTYDTGDARLGVGTDGQSLVADSTQATGLKWSTPTGGGDMLGANNLSDVASAATSRTNLNVDIAGTGNSTNVTLAGTGTYLSLAGQEITQDPIDETHLADLDYLDFDASVATPTWQEGRIFYDKDAKTLAVYDDESEATLQVGQEQRVRVYNANGVTIANGAAVTVTGLTVDGVIEVELAIASDKTSALNTIGIATHDIEPSTYGWATTSGTVNGVDTSSYTEGAAIYLSDSVAGAYQETRPLSPSYEVRMGGIIESDVATGKIYAELRIINNDQDNNAYFNGAILEANSVVITSNGTTVNLQLDSQAANNRLSLIFDQGYVSVTSGINIDLTLGTDTVPVQNWVYIDDTGTMLVSTSGFPTGIQFTPVARCVVPSAATAQTYGLYKVHAYTDHLQGSNGQGHLSHLNDWVRKRPAAWQNGVVLTQSVAEGTSAATIDLAYTSGTISQLHDHTFPVYDTSIKPAFVVNDFATPYEIANGITSSINTDSLGGAIGTNKYYNLVVWGVISQETKDCKLFFNLPSGSYTNVTDAVNDVDNYTDYTIPVEYLGTGFLITKLTLKRTASNVEVQVGSTTDLRGSIPAVGGGSVIGGGGITVFDSLTDTPITKVGQSLKAVRVNVGETALEYFDLDTEIADNTAVAANTAKVSYTDAAKVATIETNADVTDTANVTSAGALMDSEVDADIKTLALPASTTISTFGASLVDDADAATARTTIGLGNVDNTSDATKKADIIGTIYPVGSLYTSTLSTNPGTLLGVGTWVAFGEGRVMVGKAASGTFGTAGATGGAETHTLTTSEMPSHTHASGTTASNRTISVVSGGVLGVFTGFGDTVTSTSTGGDGAHNNLQPYIVVYMWERTA